MLTCRTLIYPSSTSICPLFRGLIYFWGTKVDRFVVMVDAGYLLRQSIEVLSKRASTSRAELEIIDPSGLINVLLEKSKATLDLSGKELLRVYWYDGVMNNGFTQQQKSLVNVNDLQLRAGTINRRGQQKGVDSLIVTDLIELTSHHAICDAVLVTGDSDLAVGIEIAQKRGVRIAVLGVEDLAAGVAHHQSFEITSRADRVGMLGQSELSQVLRYVSAQQPAVAAHGQKQNTSIQTPAPVDMARIEAVVKSFIGQQATPLTSTVDHTTNRIDAVIDKALLHHVFTELNHGRLQEAEKIYARQVFRSEV